MKSGITYVVPYIPCVDENIHLRCVIVCSIQEVSKGTRIRMYEEDATDQVDECEE